MNNIIIKTYEEFDNDVLDIISSLENKIFDEPYSKEKLQREAKFKNNLIILIAFIDGLPCGYKIGFERSSRIFYSWIGGVLPKYRSNGIGRKLLEKQHMIIPLRGYSCISTFTENKYKEMLLLNIKSGFDIVGVYKSDHDEKQTIMLEKMI